MVEHHSYKVGVLGSIPSGCTAYRLIPTLPPLILIIDLPAKLESVRSPLSTVFDDFSEAKTVHLILDIPVWYPIPIAL